MLYPFEYFAPNTLAEASELLVRLGPRARPLAGGTALLAALERGQTSAEAVVNLKAIPGLREILFDPAQGLTLGALVTLADLIQSPVIRSHAPVLVDTARVMATPQVRTLATVGGNLCQALPAADLAVTLLALDAQVSLSGPQGSRTLALDQFFAAWGGAQLAPGEILTTIHVPPSRPALYTRFSVREAVDVPLANLAVALDLADGRVKTARIVVGANGPRPTRAIRAERALLDQTPTPTTLAEVADLVVADYYPADDARASRWYRQTVMRVLVQRALKAVLIW